MRSFTHINEVKCLDILVIIKKDLYLEILCHISLTKSLYLEILLDINKDLYLKILRDI